MYLSGICAHISHLKLTKKRMHTIERTRSEPKTSQWQRVIISGDLSSWKESHTFEKTWFESESLKGECAAILRQTSHRNGRTVESTHFGPECLNGVGGMSAGLCLQRGVYTSERSHFEFEFLGNTCANIGVHVRVFLEW